MPPSAVQNSQGHYMAAYEAGTGIQGFNANAKHHSLHRKTPGERVSDITRLLQVGSRHVRGGSFFTSGSDKGSILFY